ncbi:hypothetical protein CCR94_18265 [Rhodoblastus sphagnicola]|uniref:Uncharacterized protein n=1 Tax=Rhodoblastus sphagnicola TaxID=333368 RepID=A0A2S6N0V1_9HYPH|nr:hypothetical protein [Rhodoblastus sphagnicola]MBB4200601.1 hypothetical protein [Rhodoblastus sphagnicola]PPQ28244.1 hypothetical protein CCR94_18265 [Rhodoblastus sphagnicola]
MLLTETQATEKWCPHTRFVFGNNDSAANRWDSVNTTQLSPKHCQCIGARCMAWRWFDEFITKSAIRNVLGNPWAETEADTDGRPPDVPADWEFCPAAEDTSACWREPEAATNAKRRGYCGLSGLPKI